MEKGDSTATGPILMFYQKFCGGKGEDKRIKGDRLLF